MEIVLGVIAVILAAAAYAWWSTGLRPFTAAAYLAVGIAVVALALAMAVTRVQRRRANLGSDRVPSRAPELRVLPTLPWVVLFALMAGLEGAGLALGGRSRIVPTLSTVVDHALAWHSTRFIMFAVWLAVGWTPAIRPWLPRAHPGDLT
jgi:hypothetical protein